MSYGLFLLVFFGIPFFILFCVWRKTITRYKKTFLWCFAFVYTLGWLWDWLSYKTGVWWYNLERMAIPFWIDGIPMEEFVGFYILGTAFISAAAFVALKRRRV